MVEQGSSSLLCRACVLFADISGFTSITEALMSRGREGADALSSLLEEVLSAAIDEVEGAGGCVAAFEGDSILAAFPGGSAAEAEAAAAALRDYFDGRTVTTGLGEWRVSARLGLALGEMEWRVVGGEGLIYIVRGPAVERAVGLCAHSPPGTLTIDREEALEHPPGELGELRVACSPPDASVASRFFPLEVLEQGAAGEFREVVPMFVSAEAGARDPDGLLDAAATLGREHGAYPLCTCFTSERPTLLLLYGAPFSCEDIAARACELALELTGLSPGGGLTCGMSSGVAYAGMTGSASCSTYTVYGDVVNSAARLAGVGVAGEVLATGPVMERAGGRFRWESLGALRLRGRSADCDCWRLAGRSEGGDPRFEGSMVGRGGELRTIRRFLEVAREGLAGCLTVYGDAGVGKSRLLREAASGMRVLRTGCDEVLGHSLGPVVHLLRDVLGVRSETDADRGLATVRGTVEELTEGCLDAAPPDTGLAGSLPVLEYMVGLRPDREAPAEFDEMVEAVSALVRSLAERAPVIIILEDLQWMDGDSRRLLRGVFEDLAAGHRMALLADSRYRGDGSEPTLFEEPAPCPTRTVRLPELDRGATVRLAEDRLGARVERELASFIWRHSGGVPFFVEQLCLFMVKEGLIEPTEGSYSLRGSTLEVPSSIRNLLVARIDRLPPGLRSLLQTASVLGQEFDVRVLALTLGGEGRAGLLDLGVEERLWTRETELTCAFRHSLLRRTAYDMMLSGRQRELHRRAAESLLGMGGAYATSRSGDVALHYESARMRPEAVHWGLKAMEQAAAAHLHEEVLAWTARLRSWLGDDPRAEPSTVIDVLRRRNDALDSLGRRGQQESNLLELLELCERSGDGGSLISACKLLGDYHFVTGDVQGAAGWYRRGMELARERGDRASEGLLTGNMGIVNAVGGRLDDARACYLEAIRIHSETGDRKMEGVVTGNLAILLRQQGESVDEAREAYLRALSIHREVGNRRGEGAVLLGLGNLEMTQDALGRAEGYYRQALEIAMEVGHRRNEVYALIALGILEVDRERWEEAAGYLRGGLEVTREIGDLSGEALVLTHLGIMYRQSGRPERARELLGRALEARTTTGDRRGACIVRGNLGCVLLESGDVEGALACYREAVRTIEELELPRGEMSSISELHEGLSETGAGEGPALPDGWQPV